MNLTYLICISIFNVGILGVYGFTRSTIRSLEMKSNVLFLSSSSMVCSCRKRQNRKKCSNEDCIEQCPDNYLEKQ